MSPVVSIITPSFNRAAIVQETADSIFNQTYPHWEWLITDDGSTDNSMEVLQQYAAKDKRVKVLQRNREPKGACTCRNISIENATGDFLVFLDTDDLLATFCLEQRVKAATQNPACDFIIFPMLLFKQKPDDTGLLWNIDNNEDDITRILMGDPVCQGTGTLWKKNSFIKAGLWSESLLLWQDIELHLRSLLAGYTYQKRLDLLPDVFIRVSDVSLSRTGYNALPKFNSRCKVYRDTVETVIAQQKLANYKKGLRFMGGNLVIGALQSSYFPEAKQLIGFCIEKGIFTQEETKHFKTYLQCRKSKLYKLPFIEPFFQKRARRLIPAADNHLGKIKYSQPIQF